MKNFRISNLRDLVCIQQTTLSPPSPSGERKRGWETFARARAHIKALSGRELDFARGFAATVSHRITMRYTRRLDRTNRLMSDGRFFHIKGIIEGLDDDDAGKKNWLVLMCEQYFDPDDQASDGKV
jgi:head-tail adaptor